MLLPPHLPFHWSHLWSQEETVESSTCRARSFNCLLSAQHQLNLALIFLVGPSHYQKEMFRFVCHSWDPKVLEVVSVHTVDLGLELWSCLLLACTDFLGNKTACYLSPNTVFLLCSEHTKYLFSMRELQSPVALCKNAQAFNSPPRKPLFLLFSLQPSYEEMTSFPFLR